LQRDKRAQQIIDDELSRYKKDLVDQMRIVEDDVFARLEKLLHGKVANGGPKKLAKGTKLSKEYLHSVEHHQWFDIRVASDEVAAQMEQVKEGLAQKRAEFDASFGAEEEEADPGRRVASRRAEDGQGVCRSEASSAAGRQDGRTSR